MGRKKILITVTAYPLPSRSYDELVCTGGVQEDGSWIRIYPVPLKFLKGLRQSGDVMSYKYNWIEIDLVKRSDDFRPESYSPSKYDFSDIKLLGSLKGKNQWMVRKKYCLKNVYTNIKQLIEDSKEPKNMPLATFKPSKITNLIVEKDSREWKDEWKELRKQTDLFIDMDETMPEKIIKKVPFKFYYKFEDDEQRESKLMIEDWEVGALYWNCLRSANWNEELALEKVYDKLFTSFTKNTDIHFFLGTTKMWHMRRANNPFVIVGLFYPPFQEQYELFNI